MDRRGFVQGSAALAGLSSLPLPALAQADRRKELLIVANEFGGEQQVIGYLKLVISKTAAWIGM